VASPIALQVAKIVVLLAISGLMLYVLCESFHFARPHHAHMARWRASGAWGSDLHPRGPRRVAGLRRCGLSAAATPRVDTTRLLLLLGDSITQG